MKKLAITLCLAITFAVPVFAQDPCSQSTKLSTTASGVQTWNGTKGATTVGGSGDDAYGVEAWTESGGNATKLTWFGPNQGGGYAFRAEWTNSRDYLGRFGYFWGSNGKKWSNLGDLCVAYNYTRSANGTGGSYSYIGVYGWTIGGNNSAEYYIVEDWFGNGQQAANNLGNNCQTRGNITVDGKQYQVVTCIRPAGSGCVSCNNQAFGQVFSIRQGMANNSSKCGVISIKKHFEEWSKISGASQYIYDKTYESKFLVEAAGGTGWFEASYMKFSRTGACGGTATPSSSSKPSSSSIAVSSSSRASSSSAAVSSSSRASSSSVAASSSSRPSSSSIAVVPVPVPSSSSVSPLCPPGGNCLSSSSNAQSSSSAVASSSSSEADPTPILKNRAPITYFSIQPQSDKALRIEISSPAVVEIFDLKGNKVEKFNVSSTQQTVKLSSPNGLYFAKVQGMKSIKFVLK